MPGIFIEGGTPLMGTVSVSGAKNSASKLIYASMFSNEEVILNNVPKIKTIMDDIEVIQSVGGRAEWVGTNSLSLNGSQINTYEIPVEVGSKFRTSTLLAGPLLYRFGKAFIPKYKSPDESIRPINRFIDTWNSLGFQVQDDEEFIKIFNDGSAKGCSINFKVTSHTATDNAIISSVFVPGETVISRASDEPEVEDLINFLNGIGGSVEKLESGKIKITGTNIFKETSFDVCSDKSEIATFAALAVLTKGNISIKNVKRDLILQFINFLNKIGARFEFSDDELRVWRHSEELSPQNLEISPTPGFLPEWQSLAVLLLTQAVGESIIHDTVYVDRYGYCVDLNRMGAKIDIVTPSEVGLATVVSDDSYDIEKEGEPKTVAKVSGPTKLKGERLTLENFKYGAVLILAALCAEGKSEIIGLDIVDCFFEGFVDKLISLGAKIWEQSD
ncbi:MAG TPA: UDP-N-acetylglucosamine 1-carboxyvinyltransferase [bacterium]|nr:UDP-N-acetylglucosamine 1-carboxyvinyltransferase [bacterium]